ncbi:hypothetical protein ABEB36_014570 [Hypothenemus hampei]|uniref:MADF domain-containing protein n=1 Tax=Hypothenemus hampei TaxID=57062 RepID=A0ABD1E6U1_HYPHA
MNKSSDKICTPEKFISLVMEYPFLYDKTKSEFKNVKKKDRIWSKIGEEFNSTGDEAKSYFKSLREKYLRLKKQREQNSKSGAGAIKEKDWEIYKIMSFLDEVIRPRKTYASFGSITEPSTSETSETQMVRNIFMETQDDFSLNILSPASTNKSSPCVQYPSDSALPHDIEKR